MESTPVESQLDTGSNKFEENTKEDIDKNP
jgi:hypothetical protein